LQSITKTPRTQRKPIDSAFDFLGALGALAVKDLLLQQDPTDSSS
jgi:hypothetical protein